MHYSLGLEDKILKWLKFPHDVFSSCVPGPNYKQYLSVRRTILHAETSWGVIMKIGVYVYDDVCSPSVGR